MKLLKKTRILALGILAMMIVTSLTPAMTYSLKAADTSNAGSISDEKKKKEELENELKDTNKFLNDLKKKANSTSEYIEELDKQMNKISDHIYELETQAQEKKSEIAEKENELKEAEVEIAEQYDAMMLRIQYMYEKGNVAVVQLFLESRDFSDFLNRAEYINKITEYDRDMMNQLRDKKNSIDKMKQGLELELKELNEMIAESEDEKKAVEILTEAKTSELKKTNANISDANADIKALKEEIAAQEELIKELEEIERKRKEEAEKNKLQITYDGGKLVWPLPGRTRISSYFGVRKHPVTGEINSYHKGIDIPAPTGTEIQACYDGEVAWAGWNKTAGNWVGIDHGDGLYTIYMHMSKILVKEGQKISKGDTVGKVGSTGRSTGPHLHLGVRVNGTYVDPLKYVSPLVTK